MSAERDTVAGKFRVGGAYGKRGLPRHRAKGVGNGQPPEPRPEPIFCDECKSTTRGHAHTCSKLRAAAACRECNGRGGRYIEHPHAEGRYVDTWVPCACQGVQSDG